ncbi:MAG: hypothetical protein QM677_07075 [Microbacterium sp.]
MSKRLQVVLDDTEYAEIEKSARRNGETVSQWVRQTLRHARDQQPKQEQARKLSVLRTARAHAFPVGDIDDILEETTRGYLS